MKKQRKKYSSAKTAVLLIMGLAGLTACITLLLKGADVRLFNTKGIVAEQQLTLALFTVFLLLAFIVPVLILLYAFAWQYRESNVRAEYSPQARHGKLFVFSMWAFPAIFMLILALVVWPATHRLTPQQTITAEAKPITIKVVAMRWKWLFIYPEQNIATVNFVQIPEDTPIQFELTADETPMSSFWIPHLGGQLYAMTGHVNRLNLIAEEPGDYPGSSAEINGKGFAGMKFTARATSREAFDRWVRDAQESPGRLDETAYKELVQPSENNKTTFYSPVESDLYDKLLMKYKDSEDNPSSESESSGH